MTRQNFTITKEFKSLLTEISQNAKKGRLFEKTEDGEDEDEKDPSVPPTDPNAPAPAPSDAQTEEPKAEPTPEDAPTPSDAPESPTDATGEADVAQAELEKAKAKKDAAESELEEEGHIKLVSPHGVMALLQLVLDPAIKTNQIDALAKKLVDKLDIEDQEDFKAFKDETIEFRGLVGFNQLVESMEPFIGSSESELNQPESI